jgi:hypothetical protein
MSRILPQIRCSHKGAWPVRPAGVLGLTSGMHRVTVLTKGRAGPAQIDVVRSEPGFAGAVVEAVREAELSGAKAARVFAEGQRREVLEAVDLVLRLRALVPRLSEEELLTLLELLPI